MSDRPQDVRTAALLQRALGDHLEAVMTVTDTERELRRFRQGARRRSRRGQALTAAAAVVLAAAAAGGALALRDDGARGLLAGSSPSSLSGRLLLEAQSSRLVELGRSDQREYRDVVLSGTADLVVADDRRAGTARLVGGGSTVQTGGGAVIVHAWGTADVTLDGQRCTGRFGYSYYYDPQEGGGSLNLSCEDGTVLGAGLVAEYGLSATNPDTWTVELTLEDGFSVEG